MSAHTTPITGGERGLLRGPPWTLYDTTCMMEADMVGEFPGRDTMPSSVCYTFASCRHSAMPGLTDTLNVGASAPSTVSLASTGCPSFRRHPTSYHPPRVQPSLHPVRAAPARAPARKVKVALPDPTCASNSERSRPEPMPTAPADVPPLL